MKKRLVALMLVLALLLCACSKKEVVPSGNDNSGTTVESGKKDDSAEQNDDEDKEDDVVKESKKLTEAEFLTLREKLLAEENVELPEALDLRDYGLTTRAKDQGQYVTCWIFGTTGAIESNALMNGYGEFDFSEYQLAYLSQNIPEEQDAMIAGEGFESDCDWYDLPGKPEFVVGPFMKGYGPALEENYPYKNITKKLSENAKDDAEFLGDSCYMVSAKDSDKIKELVIKNGGLAVGLDAINWDFYGSAIDMHSGAVYDNGGKIDHYLTLVGWDDNYSKYNFLNRPEGNGAWIIKNSWGMDVGDGGYLYVSYYDGSFFARNQLFSFTLMPKDSYDYQYQYDGGFGAGKVEGLTGTAMAFKVKANETMTGVRIYPLPDAQGAFEALNATVTVYKNVASTDKIDESKVIYTSEHTIKYAGYQTLKFEDGLNINKGDTILVTVTFDKAIRYAYDCPFKGKQVDQWGEPRQYHVISTANLNETFMYLTEDSAWKDCVEKAENSSMCMKVIVKNGHNK